MNFSEELLQRNTHIKGVIMTGNFTFTGSKFHFCDVDLTPSMQCELPLQDSAITRASHQKRLHSCSLVAALISHVKRAVIVTALLQASDVVVGQVVVHVSATRRHPTTTC